MLKRNLIVLALMMFMAGASSCIFDPKVDPGSGPPPPPEWKDLTHKEDVLINLETSYNRRDIKHYDALLDLNFTFFFAPGDVGGTIPDQWGRAEDLPATTRLFDKTFKDPTIPTCLSISMDLGNFDNIQWVEVTPASAPDETWYTTTAFYIFTFKMSDGTTYIANTGSKAQFTVRDAGTDGKHHWQLVEFRDLGSAT